MSTNRRRSHAGASTKGLSGTKAQNHEPPRRPVREGKYGLHLRRVTSEALERTLHIDVPPPKVSFAAQGFKTRKTWYIWKVRFIKQAGTESDGFSELEKEVLARTLFSPQKHFFGWHDTLKGVLAQLITDEKLVPAFYDGEDPEYPWAPFPTFESAPKAKKAALRESRTVKSADSVGVVRELRNGDCEMDMDVESTTVNAEYASSPDTDGLQEPSATNDQYEKEIFETVENMHEYFGGFIQQVREGLVGCFEIGRRVEQLENQLQEQSVQLQEKEQANKLLHDELEAAKAREAVLVMRLVEPELSMGSRSESDERLQRKVQDLEAKVGELTKERNSARAEITSMKQKLQGMCSLFSCRNV